MKIKEQFPSKYISNPDLKGEDRTIKIKDCLLEEVGKEQQPVLYFYGVAKGLVLNKTRAAVIEDELGTDETDDWQGEWITIRPGRTTFGGKMVDTIEVLSGPAAKKLATAAAEAEAERKGGSKKAKAAAAKPAAAEETEEVDPDEIPF